MNASGPRIAHHFVPRTYLKRWADQSGRVWTYRTLVSHPDVPRWRRHSTRSVGVHEHLYTLGMMGGDSDEVEQWLAQAIDGPAEPVLEKIAADEHLTTPDWEVLFDFFAASQARTPAFLMERIREWGTLLPPLIEQSLRNTVERLERGEVREAVEVPTEALPAVPFPSRARVRPHADGAGGQIEAEILTGRQLWLWEMQRLVHYTGRYLRLLPWSIHRPPEGWSWLTSDDPVLRLNYNGRLWFSFTGGWGSRGTELILPLTPQHLLYARVGHGAHVMYSRMGPSIAREIQRMIAIHAHRLVFGVQPESLVSTARPRRVDALAAEQERQAWRLWPREQSAAERELRE